MTRSPEIQGYCPVAYFLADQPLKGNPEFSSTHNERTYHFVSEEAKQEFESNPDKYVPAFGGKCAFGMSIEKDFDPCPKNYKVINGRLYLFLHSDETDALELWNKEDESKCLANANRYWTSLQEAV